jgi:hypothetical protein
MNSQYQMTLDSLVKDELDGKSAAIGLYDDMLWKIRTGYAVLLYGAVGIIAGLVNEQIVVLGKPTGLASSTIILGFSVFGALMDYSFMRSKLRVVDYRDRLLELSYHKATSGAWPMDGDRFWTALRIQAKETLRLTGRSGLAEPHRLFIMAEPVCFAS